MAESATLAPHLAVSARERLKQTPVRAAMALIIAWCLWVSGQGAWVPAWLAISTVVQLIEFAALRPYRAYDPVRSPETSPGHAAEIFALGAIALFSAVFALAVVAIWRHGDAAVAAASIMALGGTLVSNIVSGIASRRIFLIGAVPYLLALIAMPFTAPPGAGAGLWPMSFAVILFCLAILAIWSRVAAARASEMKALADAEARLAQAEAAMADRAAMAAIVSHELRTPVSAILAGAHVIRHGDRPEQTAETAALILDAGRLMTGMLDDLLDHSKIEARGMTLEQRDFDLAAFAVEAARFWAAPAAEKGLTLSAPALAGPVWLMGDPFRLRQIVNNLVSNALKFTERGTVTIEVEAGPLGDGRRTVRLTVRDQGVGIPAEAMDRLFAPFAQASSEVARTYGGTGLGLTVSRELARLMGGDLTAASTAGQGAAFTLSIELPEGEPVVGDDLDAVAPALQRRIRVLAVDDHEINRRTLALVLQPLDVDLATAVDGHSALRILGERPFDAVLMDVNMPGIDGNETTRRLRASGGMNARVPVIGFSAGTEAAQVEACRQAGMTDWLPKPLEPRRLYEALDRAVRAERAEAA